MPKPLVWSVEVDRVIINMRADGATWAAIAAALGSNRNTIIERGRRLKAMLVLKKPENKPVLPRDTNALPPGHPITWSAICAEPFPSGK